mmetsp:Transcript_9303/g.14071  ORF Transcript_9303/g.14071 Transcript_9303/m.14071 type:complete len:400 (-) Transcript_9303:63-1262(-)
MGGCVSSNKEPESAPSIGSPTTTNPNTATTTITHTSGTPPTTNTTTIVHNNQATGAPQQTASDNAVVDEQPDPTMQGEDWYYIDLNYVKQGPFSTYQMQNWMRGDLLPMDLTIASEFDPQDQWTPLVQRKAYFDVWKPGMPNFLNWQESNRPENETAPPTLTQQPTTIAQPPVKHDLHDASVPAPPSGGGATFQNDSTNPTTQPPTPGTRSTTNNEPAVTINNNNNNNTAASSSAPPLPPPLASRTPPAPPTAGGVQASSSSSFPQPGKHYGAVLYDYNQQQADEKSIHYNEIIEIESNPTTPPPEEWSFVVNPIKKTDSGLVPSNYIAEISLDNLETAVAECDWVSDAETKPGHCLVLKKGMRILVLEKLDNGWWTGVCPETATRGLYPAHFCSLATN